MNLQLLSNGTPDEKKWLDIVCYDIKCNSITPNVPFVTVSDKIESNDLSSSITCNDIGIGGGGMSAVGNINMNLNLLRNVGAIDTTDATLNITTPTTQIVNGSSEIKLDVDSVDRVVIDNTKTSLYSKSVAIGPSGSYLNLNDDSTFSIGTYFANNGAVDCTAGSLSMVGPGASSAFTLTNSNITASIFNGFLRIDREIIDATSQIFKDGNQVERLRVDNSGVTIGNSYTLPTSDGLANQYIYTNGAGVCSWASPTAINPFNQNLNTSDSVQFVNVNVNGNYTLPSTVGTIKQVLTRDIGNTSVWSTPQIYGLYSATGSPVTVANTTVASTIIPTGVGNLTVPANFFTAGMSFLLKCGGTFRDNVNNTQFTMRLTNSGTLFSTGLLTLNNVPLVTTGWNVETQFTYTGGTQIITNFTFSYNDGSDARGFTNQQVNNTFNPLVSNTLNFTMQWAVANINNTLTCNYFTLTKLF
jgi:hypothetical protein